MDKTRFLTLLRREWLQHRTGWYWLMGLPLALMLVVALLGGEHMRVSLDDEKMVDLHGMAQAPAALQTMIWSLALPGLTSVLALLAVAIQLPGLARRDAQDRSIEFWRSLPLADGPSVAATLLMHLLLLPMLAMLVALAGAQLVALVSIFTTAGPWAWLTQPWWQLVPAILAVALRSLLALALVVLWLSPILLLGMAASAWLKRWGVPVVVLSLVVGVQLMDPRLPQPVVGPALQWLMVQVQQSFISQPLLPGVHIARPEDVAPFVLPDLPGWAWRDGWAAVQRLATPGLLPVLGGAALGFWLLVLKRRQG
jgi:ABC-2 type transport system permease protein